MLGWDSIVLSRQCSKSSVSTILRRRLRRWFLNTLGWVLYRVTGWRGPDLSLSSLLASSSFTPEEIEQILPPATYQLFDTLSRCWNEDPRLALSGRYLLRDYYTELLRLRWRICQYFTQHQLDKVSSSHCGLERPLFLVGWPRVGSTFLHKLLSCDPLAKCPPLYQVVDPVPVVAQGSPIEDETKRELIADTQQLMDSFFDLEPTLFMLHEMRAPEADECCHLFEQSWVDRHSPIASGNMQAYWKLLSSMSREEKREVYEFYKKTLMVMSHCFGDAPPSHHILKDATHSLFVEAILDTFPDANVLLLHREPASVAQSCLSGMGLVAQFYYRSQDVSWYGIAQRTLQWMKLSQERVNADRAVYTTEHPDRNPFLELQFRDLTRDPIQTVQQIYNHYGYEYTLEFEENMRQFLVDYEQFRKSKPSFPHSFHYFHASNPREEINAIFDDQ